MKLERSQKMSVSLIEGKSYYLCACGLSKNGAFCDGSHKNTELKPGFSTDVNGSKIELNSDYMVQKTERRSEMVYANVVEPSFGLEFLSFGLHSFYNI